MANVFFNCSIDYYGKNPLESCANVCLSPVRYLFSGKKVTIVKNQVQSQTEFSKKTILKTALAILSLPLGLIFGTLAKCFALMSSDARKMNKKAFVFLKSAKPSIISKSNSVLLQQKSVPPIQKPSDIALQWSLEVTFEIPFGTKKGKAKEIYDLIKQKLNGKKDIRVRFDDNEQTITFAHHLNEIIAILTQENLRSYFSRDLSVTTSSKIMAVRPNMLMVGGGTYDRFKLKEEELLKTAEAFLTKREISQVVVQEESEKEIIANALGKHQGICIGEKHSHSSPKQWLMENMEKFRQQGVKTLFMEHLFHDSMQKMLDEYCAAPKNTPLPPYLEAYLDELDDGHNVKSKQYNFKQLVIAAKEAGLRIVAIDTTVSYYCGNGSFSRIVDNGILQERYKAMNYVATQIMEAELAKNPGKFVAFMGNAHLSTCEGIKGVAELMHCPSLNIEDSNESGLKHNVKDLHNKIAHLSYYLQKHVKL